MKVNKVLAANDKRFYNALIDTVAKFVLASIIGIIIGVYAGLTNNMDALEFFQDESFLYSYVESIIISTIYYSAIESLTGKSLGKFITKTRVVLENGTKPAFSDIFLRSLCRIIPFDAFSFLGEPGKGWHDTLSNTYVIDEKKLKEQEAINEIDQLGSSFEDL